MRNKRDVEVLTAKCGNKSFSYCKKKWKNDDECKKCQLVRRKSKKVEIDGKEYKKCSYCGEILPLSYYYKFNYKGKTYLRDKCKMCTSKINLKRYHEKRNKGSEEK